MFVSIAFYQSETLKQTEKNWGISRNKPKNNQNRLSFSLFWFEPKKKIDYFEQCCGSESERIQAFLAETES
jgi:hypothetical protein